MQRLLVLVLAVTGALGCEKEAPVVARPAGEPEVEPSKITVQHVLIAFRGARNAPDRVTRGEEEARAFAMEILNRVRNGEDIEKLAKEHSTDAGGGLYTLVNHGHYAGKPDIARRDFIKPFTDVAFKLKLGEAGLVEYDSSQAPYGWHVIKRLK